jgi:hypothetical protein
LLLSGNYYTKVQIAQHLANCGFAVDPSRVMTALRRAGGVVVPGTRRKPTWYNGQPPANEAAADLRRTRSIMISYPHNRQGLVDYVLQNWKKLSRKAHAQVMTWLGKECEFQKIALPFLRKLEKRLGL